MSARRVSLLLALLACAARAHAAVIEGQITHPSRPEAVAHLVVEAIGLDPKEQPIVRETKSDAQGHYRFEDLPAPAAYLVRAHFGGLTYPGGTAPFPPNEADKTKTLDFKIYDKTQDGSTLKITSLQWVIVRSAGVWRVQESATIANSGDAVVLVSSAQPAPIQIGLAPGHGDLETFFGRLPEGAEVHGDVVDVRGPVFPGDEGFSLQVEYDLDQKGDLATSVDIPSPVGDLGIYVQDFGIEVEAGELHPARPVRQDDRMYQTFIGFDLPSGTRLPLAVRVLPPVSRLPIGIVALLAALGAGALLFFVAAPILREALARDDTQQSLEAESPAKAALASALRDLEHDFETGKLSPEDRVRLREDLRREAVAALARERAPAAPVASATPPAGATCSCGRISAAGDRFCPACGKPL